MSRSRSFMQRLKRFSPELRKRGAVLQNFSKTIGLVHFGDIHQHYDDLDSIRGFTASLTHRDTHFSVGTYNGFNIRMVNRFDVVKLAGNPNSEQLWTIIEIEHGKIIIYITEHRLTKAVLESTLASGLWLAETIEDANED